MSNSVRSLSSFVSLVKWHLPHLPSYPAFFNKQHTHDRNLETPRHSFTLTKLFKLIKRNVFLPMTGRDKKITMKIITFDVDTLKALFLLHFLICAVTSAFRASLGHVLALIYETAALNTCSLCWFIYHYFCHLRLFSEKTRFLFDWIIDFPKLFIIIDFFSMFGNIFKNLKMLFFCQIFLTPFLPSLFPSSIHSFFRRSTCP